MFMFGWLFGKRQDAQEPSTPPEHREPDSPPSPVAARQTTADEINAMYAELFTRAERELPDTVPQWMPTDCPLWDKGYHIIIAAGLEVLLKNGGRERNEQKLDRIATFCERFAAEKGVKLIMAGDHRDDYLVYVGLKSTA